MKLIKAMVATALVISGSYSLADPAGPQPNLSVGNGTQHYVAHVIYQTPSQPYDHELTVQQNFASPMPGFPDGESVKVTRFYFTYSDGSIMTDPISNNGCSNLDKNRFYVWVEMQATEKDGHVALNCATAY